MQVQLSGQQIEITPALRDHVNHHLEQLTRHDDRLLSLNVVLWVDKLQQCAEGTLNAAGASLHAQAGSPDMYASIDTLFDKLLVQLRKHRKKTTSKQQRPSRKEHQIS